MSLLFISHTARNQPVSAMKYLENFHKQLSDYRHANNLSLEDISELCSVDSSTVASWEADNPVHRAYPNLAQLIDLCLGLNVALESFLNIQEVDSGQLELPGLRFIEEGDLTSSLDELDKELEKIMPTDLEIELLRRFRKSDEENKKLIIQLMSN